MVNATSPLRLLLDSPMALEYLADLALVGAFPLPPLPPSGSSRLPWSLLKGFLVCDGRSHWCLLLLLLEDAALLRWEAKAMVVSGRLPDPLPPAPKLDELMALPGGAVLFGKTVAWGSFSFQLKYI